MVVANQLDRHGPAVYICTWISFSTCVILFNKYIFTSLDFKFPIFLTFWHLVFASIATRCLRKWTHLLDDVDEIQMTPSLYCRGIVPIAVVFCAALVTSNYAYLYISVAFIQMLKSLTPVMVLALDWSMNGNTVDRKTLLYVFIIMAGTVIASYGELEFVLLGVILQLTAVAAEALRLLLVEKLLNTAMKKKMNPLSSLYYFAPICALLNGIACYFYEGSSLTMVAIHNVGLHILFLNGLAAFGLNVAVVFLIGNASALILCVSGVVKDVIIVLLSTFLWSKTLTAIEISGYSFALLGVLLFKSRTMAPERTVREWGQKAKEMLASWRGLEMEEKHLMDVRV
ncbi:DMT family organic anion transporter [Fimicolochytrium jonesii]|uniref:DMT family organic anion transporter n=1 Tax=Fimicolochytrium jonesii TaxID=1396493 RepID=UPI0022FF0608|nr:DMT family organic anion transporter [Fimicolochytrium jonesii]KAI8816566.1 DMT family organic anion transporter [Fimicolochytrium jonesii]